MKAAEEDHRPVGNRQPSGFVRPTLISDELADFLGVDHGSMMARTTVSGLINAYIRSTLFRIRTTVALSSPTTS
jgi:hypothetical protein